MMKYLEEMALVAQAVQNTFGAKKMNYELLGNGDSHLYWHLFPRNDGDLEEYGRLSFESGQSSIDAWESGAPEQISLYNIMKKTPGIYGGRFAGAGFKGCCYALVDPERADEVADAVSKAYLKQYPELAEKYSVHMCDTADGVQL